MALDLCREVDEGCVPSYILFEWFQRDPALLHFKHKHKDLWWRSPTQVGWIGKAYEDRYPGPVAKRWTADHPGIRSPPLNLAVVFGLWLDDGVCVCARAHVPSAKPPCAGHLVRHKSPSPGLRRPSLFISWGWVGRTTREWAGDVMRRRDKKEQHAKRCAATWTVPSSGNDTSSASDEHLNDDQEPDDEEPDDEESDSSMGRFDFCWGCCGSQSLSVGAARRWRRWGTGASCWRS